MSELVHCTLCGLPTTHPMTDGHGGQFCCPACQEVSHLLAAEASATSEQSASAAATAATTLQLGGLWCNSCAWLVGARLQRVPGVAAAEPSFIRHEVRVAYDPARVTPRQLARTVRRTGYRAWLEGETPVDEEEAHWLRLLIGGMLAMHVMVISFIIYVRGWLGLASPDTVWLAQFFGYMMIPLTLGVIIVLGLPVSRAGLAALRQGRPNTHTLIALGAMAAFALSVRNALLGGHVYFDTTCVLFFLLAIGRWLEMRAQKESRQAVEALWQQMPAMAMIVTPAGEQAIPADQVLPGSRVCVRPGERLPIDGLIAAGQGDVDESWLTGEPEPVLRRPGDMVLAGSVNLDGSLEIITRAAGARTTVGQIGHLLQEATWSKAPVERLADQLAAWMTPLALCLAVVAFFYWSAVRELEIGLTVALSVLLIACPCALGLATPLTLWLGLGRAAERGVLLRRAAVLEQLAAVRHAFFDKTGTLTRRPLQLVGVRALDDEEELCRLAAAVEARSEHPLGQALVAALPAPPADGGDAVGNFRNLPGLGVAAAVGGRPIWLGSWSLMENVGLTLPARLATVATTWQADGLRVIYAGWAGQVRGLFGLGEQVRREAFPALASLKALDVEVAILTGDEAASGKRWQGRLGVPVIAGLRPEDKLRWLLAAPCETLMVGDGINDSPALATATVGLALRGGTDIACLAADAILLPDDLQLIPWLVALSRRTLALVRQNLAWAFAYNLFGLLLALTGLLQPSVAALLMVASNLIVTTNALRLRRWDLQEDVENTVSLRPATQPASVGAALDDA